MRDSARSRESSMQLGVTQYSSSPVDSTMRPMDVNVDKKMASFTMFSHSPMPLNHQPRVV